MELHSNFSHCRDEITVPLDSSYVRSLLLHDNYSANNSTETFLSISVSLIVAKSPDDTILFFLQDVLFESFGLVPPGSSIGHWR